MASLAIDIGGTFTERGRDPVRAEVPVGRQGADHLFPTPPGGCWKGAAKALDSAGVDPAQVERLIHGTTLVTNALIERKGARTRPG